MTDPRSKYHCEKCLDRGIWKDFAKDKVIVCPFCKGKEPKIKPLDRQGNYWNNTWMDLAIAISKKSTCSLPDRQVGCVIIPTDNSAVLALGYNGGAKGGANVCDAEDSTDVGNSRCTCVHAEMNALTKLNPSDPCKKKMYLTLSPCALCWKLIVNAGINEVIFLNKYDRDVSPISEMILSGIKVSQYEDNRNQ